MLPDKAVKVEVGSRVRRRMFPLSPHMFQGKGQPREGWTYTVTEVRTLSYLTLIRLEGLPKTRGGEANWFNAALFELECGCGPA